MENTLKREPDGHLYWLDLIRFLAAFAVMACHFRGSFFVEYSALQPEQQNIAVSAFYFITRLGFEAVMIFFVLSGLLVGGRAMQRLAAGTFRIKSYVIDRAVRIMLPLIASLFLFLPICLYFHIPINVIDWIGSLLSLQRILTGSAYPTLWSLSYEVWFYILMCAIGILIMKRKSPTSIKYNIGFVLLIISLLVYSKLSVEYLFVWFIGAIALWRLPKPRKSIMAIMAFLSLLIIVMLQLSSGSHFIPANIFSGEVLRKCLVVLFGFVFAVFIQHIIQMAPNRRGIALHINTLGTKLAAFSYTLYLTHIPVLELLEGLGAPKCAEVNAKSIGLYILWMAIAMIIAYALYYVFERNTAVVKKYIKSKLHIS